MFFSEALFPSSQNSFYSKLFRKAMIQAYQWHINHINQSVTVQSGVKLGPESWSNRTLSIKESHPGLLKQHMGLWPRPHLAQPQAAGLCYVF